MCVYTHIICNFQLLCVWVVGYVGVDWWGGWMGGCEWVIVIKPKRVYNRPTSNTEMQSGLFPDSCEI